MQVSDLKVGQRARVRAFGGGDKGYRQQLLAMGLVPGVAFTLARVAPFGDTIEILLRGFALSLRKGEANMLEIEAC